MTTTLERIVSKFPISDEEYHELHQKFDKLCCFAVWQLKKRNQTYDVLSDVDDDIQELRIALLRAASYYKRQSFIEDCFRALSAARLPGPVREVVDELWGVWESRRLHGSERKKFAAYQEEMLWQAVERHVKSAARPSASRPLRVDRRFHTYCKQIVWNAQKTIGKKLTRDKSRRRGESSLTEHEYLGLC